MLCRHHAFNCYGPSFCRTYFSSSLCEGFRFGIRGDGDRLQTLKLAPVVLAGSAVAEKSHIECLCFLQVMGFAWLLVLFLACGLAYGPLTGSAAGLRGFQTLYFVSSFWAQFGPNATTFLVVRCPAAPASGPQPNISFARGTHDESAVQWK